MLAISLSIWIHHSDGVIPPDIDFVFLNNDDFLFIDGSNFDFLS